MVNSELTYLIVPCPANIISWAANNLEGVYKRGISFGFIIGIGQVNGIVSSAIYPNSDKPQYYTGNAVCLGYIVVFSTLASLVTHFLLEAENKARRAGKRDHWVEGKSPEEIRIMGDQVYVIFLHPMTMHSMLQNPLTRVSLDRTSSTRHSCIYENLRSDFATYGWLHHVSDDLYDRSNVCISDALACFSGMLCCGGWSRTST
nr:putative transporter c11d3.18c [Quercus suber]